MFNKFQNLKKHKRGFTLIELLLVIPLISVIFIIAYNIILMTMRSFSSTSKSFSNYEDIRMFQINIQKEANQARKAIEIDDVMESKKSDEIYIYTDVTGDKIPERIRYRLDKENIKRDIQYPILKSDDEEYPYKYKNDWLDEKIILSNVTEFIIKDIEFMTNQDEIKNSQKSKDYRKKATLKVKINIGEKNNTIEQNIILVTKSRAEAK